MVKALAYLELVTVAACTFFHSVYTHEQSETELNKVFAETSQAALAKCFKTKSSRLLQERAVTRRTEAVDKLRQDHFRRRLAEVTASLNASHKSSLTGITATTSASVLFSTSASCIAQPEVTEGPYYVRGEYIRTDMREEQDGIVMYMDVQVIDVNTCDPVKDMYIDLWHANSTGVYSGVVVQGNGNSADQSNLQTTFLRGVTPTDKDGVAQMTSIFPGHYTGRTTHVHFIGNYDTTVLPNNTYSGGHVSHVGQFFFDQDLITSVEAIAPYSTNKQSITLNSKDQVYSSASGGGYDPIFQYSLVGDSVEDGVYAWISVGVDMTAERNVMARSSLTVTTKSSMASRNANYGGLTLLVALMVSALLFN